MRQLILIESMEDRRLFAALVPDVTWGDDGYLSRAGSGTFLGANSNGLLEVVYSSTRNNSNIGTIHRYSADGVLDPAFKSIVVRGNFQIALDQQGRPYVGVFDASARKMLVTRYAANGKVDTTFGKNGSVLIQLGSTVDQYNANFSGVKTSADGSVFFTISFDPNFNSSGPTPEFFGQVYKVAPDGSLDDSFGTGGTVSLTTQFLRLKFESIIGVDSSNRIYLLIGDGADNSVVRLNSAGEIDSSLGVGGEVGPFTYTDSKYIALDAKGRLLVLDYDQNDDGFTTGGRINRFTADGMPDTSFGNFGVSTFTIPSGELASIGTLLPQQNGKIIVQIGDQLKRYNEDGTLDRRFGERGVYDTTQSFGSVAAQLRDGSFISRVFSLDEQGINAIAKLALEVPALLGRSKILYIRGTDNDDHIDIRGAGSFNSLVVDFDGVRYDSGNAFDAAVGVRADLRKGNDSFLDNYRYSFVDLPITVRGGAGNDSIATGDQDDSVDSGVGDDTINTFDGNDVVAAGHGRDSVTTGAGNDLVFGSSEVPITNEDDDFYDLGAGNDRVLDGFGNNTILGGDGDDSLRTGDGNDSITGGLGKDTIRSGAGNDTIDGGGGRDRLYGMAGNDRILGGSNNDTLVGDDGADTLIGNAGDDLIVSTNADSVIDHIDGGSGNDSLLGDDDHSVVSIEVLLDSLA